MAETLWFRQAVAVLAARGHIEVNLVPDDVSWFTRQYRKFVGRKPTRGSFNVARDPNIKGGSELRIVLDSDDEQDKRIVERGLGITLRSGAGGKGFRKGSRQICMRLIQAGLDIGRRPPHKPVATARQLRAEAKKWEKNAKEYLEGFRKEITREISSRNRSVIESAKRVKGYRCMVCGFDFGEFYGLHGEGFIEAHHKEPISSYNGPRRVTEDDIDPVCANCHRMLHRGDRLLTVAELKEIIARSGCVIEWPWEGEGGVPR